MSEQKKLLDDSKLVKLMSIESDYEESKTKAARGLLWLISGLAIILVIVGFLANR